MRSRYRVSKEGGYLITSTIVEWIPVFTTPDTYEIVTESLAFCRREKGLKIRAFAILDNHLHLLAEAPDLSRTMQAFKRHTASRIVEHAESANRPWLLDALGRYKKSYKTESRYQVWQEGFHPKRIQGEAMLAQKIGYIHNNPVRRGWVDAPEHWRYSSARNHYLDDHSVLEIDLEYE